MGSVNDWTQGDREPKATLRDVIFGRLITNTIRWYSLIETIGTSWTAASYRSRLILIPVVGRVKSTPLARSRPTHRSPRHLRSDVPSRRRILWL